MSDVETQVDAFKQIHPLYESFASKLESLLYDIVSEAGISIHLIESRAKTISSFREKITRSGKSYNNGVDELPDLCGCRVIAYYQDDCDRVASEIKNNFEIIEEELSHHPNSLAADRFGYISAHYVVKLSNDRAKLSEWKKYSDLRVEIQVRTVIQHAWSAVSHALQYKSESSVPSKLQRRLYRISGLFELADEEFSAIRDQKILLRAQASEAIASGNTNVPLSIESIEQFLDQWPRKHDVVLAGRQAGFTIIEGSDDKNIADIYDILNKNNIRTIDGLSDQIKSTPKTFFKNVIENQSQPAAEWDASADFLIYLMLIYRFRKFITADLLISRGWRKDIAKDIVEILSKKAPNRKLNP